MDDIYWLVILRIVMFKNLGFERLRITSPRLYHTKVKNFFFKKRGGYDPLPPPTLARFVLDAARN